MFTLAPTCSCCMHKCCRGRFYMYMPASACETVWMRVCTCVECATCTCLLLDVVCAPHQAALGLLLSLLRNQPFCVSNQSCASRSPAKPLILGLLKSCFN